MTGARRRDAARVDGASRRGAGARLAVAAAAAFALVATAPSTAGSASRGAPAAASADPASEASPVKAVRANGRGRFRTRVPIAADAVPGRYVMLACRRQCAVKRSANFRITS